MPSTRARMHPKQRQTALFNASRIRNAYNNTEAWVPGSISFSLTILSATNSPATPSSALSLLDVLSSNALAYCARTRAFATSSSYTLFPIPSRAPRTRRATKVVHSSRALRNAADLEARSRALNARPSMAAHNEEKNGSAGVSESEWSKIYCRKEFSVMIEHGRVASWARTDDGMVWRKARTAG